MAQRSKSLQKTLDSMNAILAMEEIGLYNEKGHIESVKSDTERAQLYKDGICTVIETMLNNSNSYKGFMFLDRVYTEARRFDRKYF